MAIWRFGYTVPYIRTRIYVSERILQEGMAMPVRFGRQRTEILVFPYDMRFGEAGGRDYFGQAFARLPE
jgi:hypothetical protein